jgi:hypothetical protein
MTEKDRRFNPAPRHGLFGTGPDKIKDRLIGQIAGELDERRGSESRGCAAGSANSGHNVECHFAAI